MIEHDAPNPPRAHRVKPLEHNSALYDLARCCPFGACVRVKTAPEAELVGGYLRCFGAFPKRQQVREPGNIFYRVWRF